MKRSQLDSKVKLVSLARCTLRGQRDNTVTVSLAVRARPRELEREGLTYVRLRLPVEGHVQVWGVARRCTRASSIDEVLESVQSHIPRQNLLKEQACIVLSRC